MLDMMSVVSIYYITFRYSLPLLISGSFKQEYL